MKVVGLVGSPREDGSTDALVREVLEGAEEAGAETRLYNLAQMDISGCRACMGCKEGEGCEVDDDMQDLYEELHGCGGVVIGTPIYFYNMSAQTKAFTDRLFALLGPGFSKRLGEDRPTVFVVTQGADDRSLFRPVIDKMAEAFGLAGLSVRDTILQACSDGAEGVLRDEELRTRAREAGRALLE